MHTYVSIDTQNYHNWKTNQNKYKISVKRKDVCCSEERLRYHNVNYYVSVLC